MTYSGNEPNGDTPSRRSLEQEIGSNGKSA